VVADDSGNVYCCVWGVITKLLSGFLSIGPLAKAFSS
jgi:hypothetical protein